MGAVRVTLPNGRIVDGKITILQKAFGEPVLIVNGKSYSGLDAVSRGFSVYPVSDPIVDRWLNTFKAGGQ